jgi:DNA-binding transcriptional LysR family regulator
MSLNLNQLRIFYACGRHHTFSDAAEELFLTPPAVTIQIRELEAFLDMALFHRHKKRIELTEAGELLFKYAEKIFDTVALAERSMGQLKDLKKGSLNIGVNRVFTQYMMPSICELFRKDHPDIHVRLYDGSSNEIIRYLVDHKIELGLVAARPKYPTQLEVIPFSREELVLALAKDHPLTRKKKISINDLKNELLIIREKGSGTREVILNKYSEAKIEPRILIESNNWSFLKEQVAYGNGISFLAESMIKEELAAGSLKTRILTEGPFEFTTVIVYPKNRFLSLSAEAFLNILIKKKDDF